MKYIILLFCFFSFASNALAAPERKYDVQVLIFSQLTPTSVQSEQWPMLSADTLNAFNEYTQITPPSRTATALQSEKSALLKNGQYRVLVNGAWMETWSGENATVTIPISNAQIRGFLTIKLGHYFDVHTNLLLTEPMELLQKLNPNGYFSHINQPNFSFQLLQDRRMKSNELNYLDHPLFGMLIKIIPEKA